MNCFSEKKSQKNGVFNTKYHEGIKDKKIKISKNKFNPKNVFCALKNSTIKNNTFKTTYKNK